MGKPLLKTLTVVAVGVGAIAIWLDIARTISDNTSSG